MTSTAKSVTKTSETNHVQLSAARAAQATKIYKECCKKLAELIKMNPDEYGLDESTTIEELMSLIPDPTFKVKSKKTQKPKKNKLTVDNWESATDKTQLKSLKSLDLKNILSEKSMAISGNKTTLVDRVWGILHPEDAPVEVKKKKRGRPKNKTKKDTESVCTIEDSDDEQVNDSDDIQNLLENRSLILVDSETKKLVSQKSDSTEEYQLVPKKNWVFKEDEENFEFIGVLTDNQLKLQDPPQILIDLFSED